MGDISEGRARAGGERGGAGAGHLGGLGGAPVVLLARHGRTELNAKGLLRGRLDPPLDAVGLAEARTLAEAIAPARPALVRSSPLQRAAATAAAIAAACGQPVELDDRLLDRDYGGWAGRARDELVAAWGSVDAAPGVEAEDAVVRRALPALEDAARRASGRPAVLVAHDAVNRALLAALSPLRFERAAEIPQRTGCVNVLRYEDGRLVVEEVDLLPPG